MKIISPINRFSLASGAFVVVLLVAASVVSFATLGENSIKIENPKNAAFKSKSVLRSGAISLRPNISFRGAQVINVNQPQKFISVNTIVTYQKGSNTFSMPIKKKVLLNGKLTFNPNAATR